MPTLRTLKAFGLRNCGPFGVVVVVVAGTMFGGIVCGGGLSYKVDDATLDAVPSSERQAVFDARRDVEIALLAVWRGRT